MSDACTLNHDERQSLSLQRASTQGLLLLGGMGTAQALSFARNACLGHALSPRDFGIAASIALLVQLVETLSDLGHDRLLVQAEDGGSDSFLAATHWVAIFRGVLLAVALYLMGPLAARIFDVSEAETAFTLVALVPLIRGFAHLDCRRAQRHFDNRPQMLVEVVPQAAALLATAPVLHFYPNFSAVVVLALVQAIAGIISAQLVANTPYRIAFDRDVINRLIAFGWPILLSALPLVAVYQGDRAIVGSIAGVEALASYSAAFMLAMVPGLLAARAGHALMLPAFSAILRQGRPLHPRFSIMTEATVLTAAVYLCIFTIAGGKLLTLAFGAHYSGQEQLLGVLATMWALRMIQAVPGMALMASGSTKPFLIAGLIRASALPFALLAAKQGASLASIAATGCAGELASLLYVAWRMERVQSGLARVLLGRALFLVPTVVTAALIGGMSNDWMWTIAATILTTSAIVASGIAMMPCLLARARQLATEALANTRLKPS